MQEKEKPIDIELKRLSTLKLIDRFLPMNEGA